MKFLTGAFLIVAMIFMCVFMFIGIWSFIVFLKSFRQSRYRNYISEKIYQKISEISENLSYNRKNNDYSYLIGEDAFDFNDNTVDNNIDNISDFSKQEKLNE